MPTSAKIRSFRLRPFLSSDLSFPRAGIIEHRHHPRAKLSHATQAFNLAAEVYDKLLAPVNDSLQGSAAFIQGVMEPHAFYTLRNQDAACELGRALDRRDTLYLEKHRAGPLAALAATWKSRLTEKLTHLQELHNAINLRHTKLTELYETWMIQRFTPDGTPDGSPVRAMDHPYKPETHGDSLTDNRITREGEYPWEGSSADTVSTTFTTSRSLPVGSMNIGSNTNINAITTGAEGEDERRHKHITGPSFNIPTSGFTQAALAALNNIPVPLDENGSLNPAVVSALVGMITNLKRFVAQETETFSPTQRTLRFNEDARHPWAEELARFHRELATLEEEIVQQTTFNRRLDFLEKIWGMELDQANLEARRAMLAYTDTFLTSPIAGIVTHVYKDAGEFVQAGEPVIRVESTDRFLLVGTVNCRLPIRVGQTAKIEILNILEEDEHEQDLVLEGLVVSVSGHDSDNDEWEVIVEIKDSPDLLQKIPLNYTFDRGSHQIPEAKMTLE